MICITNFCNLRRKWKTIRFISKSARNWQHALPMRSLANHHKLEDRLGIGRDTGLALKDVSVVIGNPY